MRSEFGRYGVHTTYRRSFPSRVTRHEVETLFTMGHHIFSHQFTNGRKSVKGPQTQNLSVDYGCPKWSTLTLLIFFSSIQHILCNSGSVSTKALSKFNIQYELQGIDERTIMAGRSMLVMAS
jgi:hypothetical protein